MDALALTFDDGFLNNKKYVVPLLNELELHASIYVTRVNETRHPFLWPDFIEIAAVYYGKEIDIAGESYVVGLDKSYVNKISGESLATALRKSKSYEFKEAVYDAFLAKGFVLETFSKDEDNWKLMSDQEIVSVDQTPYVRIECHSFFHNNLGELTFENAKTELKQAKASLEKLLGRKVTELAYPDGSYSRSLIDYAVELGFTRQLAADVSVRGR